MKPRFFRSVAAFRRWLTNNHAKRTELFVGLYKKHAAHRGMTYVEAVDEALCWGWIDGVIRRLDEDRVVQRFTPRTARSTWSLVNVGKVERLMAAGRMQPPGMKAFEARDAARTGIYSFERARAHFTPEQTSTFKRAAAEWKWFRAQAESYQRVATFWVVSAKQEVTRARRLAQLIEHSSAGKKLRQFTPMPQRAK
ncbi:MAG TPA: YdeI/OmpD-associated family protein [Gemmatimonadales bacterium]|nr:YdeI/OmpD-associated family protein [Gemmatimonadales bacterium]